MNIENNFGHVEVLLKTDEITEEEYALLDYVFVKEEYRRQGHATPLVMEAIRYAKTLSDNVKIVAHEFDEDVIELADLVDFYENCGFKVEVCADINVVMVI